MRIVFALPYILYGHMTASGARLNVWCVPNRNVASEWSADAARLPGAVGVTSLDPRLVCVATVYHSVVIRSASSWLFRLFSNVKLEALNPMMRYTAKKNQKTMSWYMRCSAKSSNFILTTLDKKNEPANRRAGGCRPARTFLDGFFRAGTTFTGVE